MLLNWIYAHDRAQRIARGEEVHDNYKRYKVLKDLEPQIDEQFKRGEINPHKYESFKNAIKAAEGR